MDKLPQGYNERDVISQEDLQKKADALRAELSQEIQDKIEDKAREFTKNDYEDHQCGKVFERQIISSNIKNYTIGAQIASEHYEPLLQSKDATIKQQAEELERVKGLLKELHSDTWQMSGKPRDIGWNDFCKQHNITP